MIKSSDLIDNMKFSIKDADYLIRKCGNDIFKIRKLSNTRNTNVIFSIKLINEQDLSDLNHFKESL